MNKLMILLVAALGVWAAIAQVGCSSKPVDELKMARSAMDHAQEQEASTYAPDDWDRARWDWEEANALISMGRFDEARSVLVLSIANFNKASDTAGARLGAIKQEVAILQDSVNLEVNKLKQVAERVDVRPADRKSVDGALPLIEQQVSAMRAAVDDKNYLRARMFGKEAQRWLDDLQKSPGVTR